MNLAVAISHKERFPAPYWARWLAALGLPSGTRLFITFDQKLAEEHRQEILDELGEVAEPDVYNGPDPGYPGGANRMFVHTARRAAKAGKPFLWIETDLIPTRRGWLDEITQEYECAGKPFLGAIKHWYNTPHVNGTAVYPANWEEITNITECPDYWPWDTFFRTTSTDRGLVAASETIVHNGPLTPKTAVIHPNKDLSLIKQFNREQKACDPSLFDVKPVFVLLQGSMLAPIRSFRLRMPGASFHIAKLETLRDQVLAFRKAPFQVIPEEEYNQYLKYL